MTEPLVRDRVDGAQPVSEGVLSDEQRELTALVHQRLLQEIDISALEKQKPEAARATLEATARVLLGHQNTSLYGEAKEAVIRAILDDAIGLGPIQPLVDDPTVSEVMVNSPEEVYFERDGIIYLSGVRFRDAAHIMRIVDRIIAPLGRRIDESVPYVDARLPDGSRVNVVIPPLIPRSPTITIRKFRPDMFSMEDLVENETIADWMVDFFRACVQYRLNTVVSGGTGTGKTTLLNALSRYLPEGERIITIEDPIELQLQQRHKISMEARPSNIEGRNEVTQRDLVRNALRMRPDRIIVGEVRGPEAFDMMQAMNTGHEGSMTTVHANSARDALSRIENMILMASLDLPIRAIREQVGSALHLVIHLQRFSDGKRRVVSVSEITGMEGDVVTMQDIFHFVQRGVDEEGKVLGDMEATGIRPTFAETLERAGVHFEWTELAMKAWK